MLDTMVRILGEKGKGRQVKTSDTFYCRNYNKVEGCQLTSPDEAIIGHRRCQVHYVCAKCWSIDQEAREHSELDVQCPHHD